MAKCFSIQKSILDSFKIYGKNWMLLTLAGAIASSIFLIDRNGPSHLHQVRTFIKQDLAKSSNVHEAWEKIQSFGRELGQNSNPMHGDLMGLVMWVVLTYLLLGLVRLCLNLGAKKPSLQLMVTMPMDFIRYLGVLFLLSAMIAVAVIASMGACIVLNWFQLPTSVIMFLMVAVLIVFVFYMLHFLFIPWCAAEKTKSVFNIISCSKSVAANNLGHIFGFMVIFSIVMGITRLMFMFIALPIESLIHLPGFACFLVKSVTLPISVLGYTSVYKQLK